MTVASKDDIKTLAANDSDKYRLINVWATWCAPCVNSEKRDDLFDNLDAQSEGGVPYTVLIAPGGEIVHRQHSSIDPAALKRIIVDRIGRTFGDDK